MLKCVFMSVLALVVGLSCVVSAQTDSVRITSTKLNDHVVMYTSAAQYEANQVALVGDDGVLLVDAGWTETSVALRERLQRDGYGKVRILISTHSHDDHTSGNRSFRNDAVVFAHRNAGDQIANRYFSLPPLGSRDVPNVLADDSLTLWFNGEEVRLTHAPACHSSGDPQRP